MVVLSYSWLVREVLILTTLVRFQVGPFHPCLGITQLVEWRIVAGKSLSNETPHVASSILAPEIFKVL